jgi:hypothetical protein
VRTSLCASRIKGGFSLLPSDLSFGSVDSIPSGSSVAFLVAPEVPENFLPI